MKKKIFIQARWLLCSLLAVFLTTNLWAETATFGTDWNSVFGTSYNGSVTGIKANQFTLSGVANSVSLTATNGSSTNGYVKTSDWRLYNGYTLTITAPENNNITSILATKGGKAISGITSNVGTLSIPTGGASMTWTGETNQVVFSITTTMGFASIEVTYDAAEGGSGETAVKSLPQNRIKNNL